ncbi:MAG TPA: TonB-dependent receptor, partial [Myxococcota bacterium]|nr:TonB-dependent receptor [Myxococcota bacterium]
VTGTLARDRSVLDSPVPIDLLSAEDLARAGAVSDELGQAIAAIAPSFHFPRQSNSGSSDHVRAGQLRGLSPDQLLVLVNGKRRHTSAIVNSETKIGRGTAAVDFNTIPLAAVKKVEILRDGAGAQYGSDAIAGVINVLLDDDPARTDIELTFGGHVTHEDAVDRDLKDGETFTLNASTGFALPDEGFLRIGLDVEDRNKTNRAGFDQIPFFEDEDNAYLAGRRNYTMGDPSTEAYGAWFNGEAPLGELTLYGFGTFGERETRGGAAFFRYPIGFQNVQSIYPDGYRPRTRADDQDLSLTAGVEWTLAGWALDSSIGYGRDELEFGVDYSLNPSFGAASPTRFDSGAYVFDQLIANVDGTRDFALGWLEEPLSLLAGIEYRRETYETRRGDAESHQAGGFLACHPDYDEMDLDSPPPCAIGAQAGPGLTPADEIELERDVVGVYFDVAAELVPSLLLDLAARYEHYSDFGSQLTGKLSAAWTLSDGVTLRGAVSNSFRAPGVQQDGFADTTTSFGSGSTLVRTRTLRTNDPISRALGAQDLDAETSFNLSFGAAARFGALSGSIDAFRIAIDDRITLSERFFDDGMSTVFVDLVSTLPNGEDVESVRYFTNAVDTLTHGIDVVVTYEADLLRGDFGLDLSFSYADTEIERYAPTPSSLTDLYSYFRLVGVEETNTIESATPQWKTVVTAEWENERWAALARLSAFGSAERVFNFGDGFEPRQRYGAELQLDLEGEYRVNEHVAIALGVVNVLDNYPDRSIADITYFGNLPYDVLSPIGVNGRYVYTRLSLTF